MDLFICYTPLQAKIALRVIELNGIKNYEVFYFTHVVNDTQKNYFKKLSEKANSAIFYICHTPFPKYFSEMKRIFDNRVFETVYVASVDNIYAHLALTYCQFEDLKTFDDGGANIDKSSLYYISERSFFADCVYFLMGSRFNLRKVKARSSEHFTIYPRMDNIIDNVVPVALFDSSDCSRDCSTLEAECSVFLGSYFRYVAKKNVSSLLDKLGNYFSKKENTFYIPHPMESSNDFSFLERLPGGVLAEDLILDLGRRYKIVNVYGIASSALFNLLGVNWVNTYTLVSSELTDGCNALSNSLIERGGNPFHIE